MKKKKEREHALTEKGQQKFTQETFVVDKCKQLLSNETY